MGVSLVYGEDAACALSAPNKKIPTPRPVKTGRRIGTKLMQMVRSLDRFLQFLGGAESDFPARLDLDGLAGGRIAAHARGALSHDENSEPADADAIAFLEVLD